MADMTKQEQIDLLQDIQGILPCNPNLQGQPELLDKMLNAIDAGAAALQASVPRVLTPEEAQNRESLFIEARQLGYEVDWMQTYDLANKYAVSFYGENTYGREWRLWNMMPTPGQMAETPWDRQEG